MLSSVISPSFFRHPSPVFRCFPSFPPRLPSFSVIFPSFPPRLPSFYVIFPSSQPRFPSFSVIFPSSEAATNTNFNLYSFLPTLYAYSLQLSINLYFTLYTNTNAFYNCLHKLRPKTISTINCFRGVRIQKRTDSGNGISP